ncbi:FecCD family ABC transporter permease [Geminicoccus roseus]|uniref:FecCD family ABC transporter permease n=1 Tax=Geminicoccus roseus TaxID=404900 RepID=UPI0003FB0B8D|nr:iron ABC transporter permease [Geminicoccus roseus]
MRIRPVPLALLLAGGIVVLAVAGVTIGSASIDPPLVGRILLHALLPERFPADWAPGLERIVVDLRLPRVMLGILTGAGLACVGVVLQAVTRNPLADPYLFGVSAGASVGAVIVIVHLGDLAGMLTLPIAAFLGAILSLFLVISVAAGSGGFGRDRLVLSGVAVSFVLMALTNFLIFSGDQRAAHSVVFWTMGGLGLAQWSLLPLPLVVVILGLCMAQLSARRLDALSLGDQAAASLGIDVARLRVGLFALCALLTGTLVALVGSIGFVGLMIPHAVRALVGGRHAVVLPLAALMGALLVTGVDILARTLLAPQELPIGIITGAVGGLFFVWLMRLRRI